MIKLCPLCRKVESVRGEGRKVLGGEDSCFLHLEYSGVSAFLWSDQLPFSMSWTADAIKCCVPGIKIAASTDMMLF